MLISKNDLLFLIVMCFFCSNIYLCKKVKQADTTCSRYDNTNPLVEYTGTYKDNKWQGTKTYDLKDKNNKCCSNKTFLSDCLNGKGRCVYCCRRDMKEVDGLAFNTNPVPDTKTYSNNVLLKCCSNKRLTTSDGRIYCCSSDVVINTKGNYWVSGPNEIANLFPYVPVVLDKKNEVLTKCQ